MKTSTMLPLSRLLALALLSTSCTALSQVAQPPHDPAAPPAAANLVTKSAVLDGQDLITAHCTVCHAPAVITAADHTPEEWAAVVQTMRQRGAKLSDQEADAVVKYLSTRGS